MVFLSPKLPFCLFSKWQSQNYIFRELSLIISKSCRNDLTILRQQPNYCIQLIWEDANTLFHNIEALTSTVSMLNAVKDHVLPI